MNSPPEATRIDAQGLRDGNLEVSTHSVASDYFATLKMPLARGRVWSASDDARAEGVTVINETMARQMWPNEDPIGKRVRDLSFVERRPQWVLNAPGRDGWFEVIGVVRDVPNRGLREPIAPAMYYPYTAALSDMRCCWSERGETRLPPGGSCEQPSAGQTPGGHCSRSRTKASTCPGETEETPASLNSVSRSEFLSEVEATVARDN